MKGLKGKKALEYDRNLSDTSITSARSPSPTPSPSGSPVLSPQFILSDNEGGSTPLKLAGDVQISNSDSVESDLDFKSVDIRRYVCV